MKNYKVNFTILITIYNESNNIDKLIAELYKSFSGVLDQFEILVVDDGSTDGVINKLENYKKQYSNFDYIHVTRNQGKANSYNQAFPVIKSKYIITIDGDLQDDIFDINRVIDLLDKYNLVLTKRDRIDSFAFKKIPSLIANFLFRCLFNIKINDFNCSMKGFLNSDDLRKAYFDKGTHRFLSYFLIKKLNYNYTEINTIQKKRMNDLPKYNSILKRFFSFCFWLYMIKVKDYNFSKPCLVDHKFINKVVI